MRRLFFLLGLLVLLAGETRAQAPAAMTAEERLMQAGRDYSAGKWEAAVTSYLKFIEEFGARPEAAAIVPKLRFPIAQCYLQMKKFPEALAAIEEAQKVRPPLAPRELQELAFNKSVCLAQEEKFTDARTAVDAFLALFPPGSMGNPQYAQQFPMLRNVPEAQILYGTCFVLEGKYKEAADFFAKVKAQLSPVNRGRATVLELYSLVEAKDTPRALTLVNAEYPRLDEMIQVATFETLTLALGSDLLDRGENRPAIACLTRVWDSARILQRQEKRLSDFEKALEGLNANPKSDPAQRLVLTQLAGKIRGELEQFKKIPNFDSALRLRLAYAYQAQERYRETALILEGMLESLPADPVVEQASVSLVQCWGQIERWPKVIEAATAFQKKFPQSKSVPLLLYLKGSAEQKEMLYDAADATLAGLAKDFPQSEYASRALFLQGFNQLLNNNPHAAIGFFEKFQTTFPTHELAEQAAFWRAMAFSLDKQYDKCRAACDQYLASYPKSENRGQAKFRKAYSAHSLRQYDTSISELKEYLREYPGHEGNSEALTLLGDAFMAQGKIEEGMSAFRRIPSADTHFFEEGWFKTGKALKLLDRFPELQAHMERFVKEYPRSSRIGEAIYWVGWVHRQNGAPEKARQLYWATIKEHGNEPSIRSIDDLFPALSKLYKGEEERSQYLAQLRDLKEAATKDNQKTLALRALWAQANEHKRADPEKSRALLTEASKLANVQTTNPLLLADFADGLAAAGQNDAALKLWRDLLKWNPRAAQKDRALAALGQGELTGGHEKAALELFDRFESETVGSPLLGKVLIARGKLLEERGDFTGAAKALDDLLKEKAAPGQDKSEALFRLAEMQMKQKKPQLAIPYYQRIYVMYGRWRETVAKAYLRSGEAFEQIADKDAARKTYEEMLANDSLADLPERKEAEQRLSRL